MKGDKFMKVVVVTLLCVLACYLVFSVTRFSGDSFTTYKAVRYEVGDGITTSGFLVRYEQLLRADTGDIIVPTRSEGEKVGKGQTVAATYRDESARLRRTEIDRLAAELAQMKSAQNFSTSDMESATLDTDILQRMNLITLSAARREFSAADQAAEEIKPLILRRYLNSSDAEALRSRIQETETRLNALYAEAQAESGVLTAPASGWFSASVDGYEEILTPEFLETATVSALERYQGISRRETDAYGKLVSSPKWFFAAIVPVQNVAELDQGDEVAVSFAYDFYQTVQMQVERVTPPENDRCILILSSSSYIQEAVSSRLQSADLVFDQLEGLRVPTKAIYAIDQVSGVYVLEGAEARWKPVEILYDNGDSFIVRLDKSSTGNLWPEDEIILSSDEIYDRKVMIK